MDQQTTQERRRVPRFPFHARASLRHVEVEYDGMLLDISYNGALFSGSVVSSMARGDACLLVVAKNSAGSRGLAVHGQVAFINNDMIGIEFHPLERDVLGGLMEIIELNLGTPSLLQRKLDSLVA